MKLKMIIILLLLDCLFLQKKSIDMAYKQFKKKVNTMKLKPKIKKKIFNEFKSTILDREFQRIKVKMLKEILQIDNQIIYSCYVKKKVFSIKK
ncbi:hypothetical protein [Thomasclavelia cocleata]|uniref:hypothetical protein n=2 Tax=Thomasclavelia cocleata TaxID=69824 RepID=UPI0025AB613B|nr:hypothetical protein [Thomasclavelia cocleata]